MGTKILIEILVFALKKDNRTRGHEVKLIKISVDWISGSTRSHRGQSMNATNYLQIV